MTRLEPEQSRIADPAAGAAVDRCSHCGLPGSVGNQLASFVLPVLDGRRILIALCERSLNDLERIAEKAIARLAALDPDPLTLPEVAG